MAKKCMRPVALLVILAMFLSLIPMWGAQAAVRSTPVGLVIGETEFLNLSTTVIWDNQSFSKSLNAQLKRSSCFVLGWQDASGTVQPIPLSEIDMISITDTAGNPVDCSLRPTSFYSVEEGDGTYLLGDGIFTADFPSYGEYCLSYTGAYSDAEGDESTSRVTINVDCPEVGLYTTSTINPDTCLGWYSTYNAEKEFWLLPNNWYNGEYGFEVADLTCNVQAGEDTVEIEEYGEGYHIVMPDNYTSWIALQVQYEAYTYFYESGEKKRSHKYDQTQILLYVLQYQEPEEEPVHGLAMSAPLWDEEGVHYSDAGLSEGDFWKTLQLFYDENVSIGWIDDTDADNVQIYPIPLDEIDNLHFYRLDGTSADDVITIAPAMNDIENGAGVAAGDGAFVINVQESGDFYLRYEGVSFNDPDHIIEFHGPTLTSPLGIDDLYCVFSFSTRLPDAAIYRTVELNEEDLLGLEATFTPSKKVFYINGASGGDDVYSFQVTFDKLIFSPEKEGGYWDNKVKLSETENGWRVTIQDGFKDKFSIFAHYTHSEYENGTPIFSWTGVAELTFNPKGFDQSGGTVIDEDEDEFDEYKEDAKEIADALAETGDSAASNALIDAAKKAIDELKYDADKTLDENKAAVDAIIEQLKKDLKAQREKDKKPAAPKYSNEWVNGKWYDADGKQTYEPLGSWKSNKVGRWYQDTSGWFPKNRWQKIDGKWYFFDKKGYQETDSYRRGWYIDKNGVWDGKAKVPGWKKDSTGWWYDLGNGRYLKDGWKKIDGIWYYFKASGYSAASEWINGWWLSANCKWLYTPRASWHRNKKGWWYSDPTGWFAKNGTETIDGTVYSFDEEGFMK